MIKTEAGYHRHGVRPDRRPDQPGDRWRQPGGVRPRCRRQPDRRADFSWAAGNAARAADDAALLVDRISPSQAARMTWSELTALVSVTAHRIADQGLAAIDEEMSQAMRDRLEVPGYGWLRDAYRGTVVPDQTFRALERVFGEGNVRYSPSVAADFSMVASKMQVELTTFAQIPAHRRRDTLRSLPENAFAGYNWPAQ